jgi:site-specific DNA-adenine methylase
MRITALAQWFGGNRGLAHTVGAALGKLRWCGVPFAGGCAELPHIQTAAGVANDLHRHIINLARVVRDDELVEQLVHRLEGALFHQDELAGAQRRCREREQRGGNGDAADVVWARDYFLACWMGRGGHAGKRSEFNQTLSARWTASGGDSAVRFRSAVESLRAWHDALKRWSFLCLDAFEFLGHVHDKPGVGLYVDAPWPDAGEDYQHRFPAYDHMQLADVLSRFREIRIAIRFGDHPLIRELYTEPQWTWLRQTGRNQQNNETAEVLIVNGKCDVRDLQADLF